MKHTSELTVSEGLTAIQMGVWRYACTGHTCFDGIDGERCNLGEGTRLRFIVDKERFISKLG